MNKLLETIIGMVLEEEPLNDPKKQRGRIKTCEECPSFNKSKRKCRICTCYMDIKTKMKIHRNPKKVMRLEVTHCPEAKWPDDDIKIVNHYRKIDGLSLLTH